MRDLNVSRRTLLTSLGAAGLGTSALSTGAAGTENAGRHIVGTSTPAATARAKRGADSVHRVLEFGDIGEAVAGQFSEEALENLERNPNVRYVEPDGTMHALAQTLPWGVDRVDADVAHGEGETGAGAHVAIIDTGIDDDHPDLEANIADPSDDSNHEAYESCKGSNCNYEWSDDNDHGTHCAGIADAVDNAEGVVGVSTEATLHAVKVLDKNGSGSFSNVAAGIQYVADQGWDVGSLSLGASSGSQTVKDACQYAYDRGVLLVAAAGNDGPCSDCVGYPAAYETVVAVSSTDEDDSLSSFSSTGPEVELAAPGGDVYSTVVGGYDTFSGTSMACPHVSGAGGQLMANGYTNAEARDRLTSTAEDLGLGGNEQGNGLLDVEAAVLDGSDDGGDNSAPTVDELSANEVETDDGDAEFDVDWAVSDDDGNLDSVDLALTDDTDGETEDTATVGVSGDTASDTTRLVAAGDDGSGNDYTVELVVTDDDGASASDTTTVSETEDDGGDGGDNAPVIDAFDLVDTSNPRWARVEVDWTVSDEDGDLSEVTTEVTDWNSTVTSGVGGSSASGTHEHRERDGHGEVEVTLTVTDGEGNTTSDTKTITLG